MGNAMKTDRILCAVLCGVFCVGGLSAQSFRKVTGVEDIEAGARYVLAAPTSADPCTVYAVVRQDVTGTGKKNRAARRFETDENGRIQTDGTDMALFELRKQGTSYMLRDVYSGGFLAYSDKKTTENKTALYTMTDEEITGAPASSGKFHKTFKFDFSLTKTCIVTAQKITTSRSDQYFYLLSTYPLSESFSLYAKEDMAGRLCLYKEVVPPTWENDQSGDWVFHGDWTVEDLSPVDYSQALRIDFTGIELPEGWNTTEFSVAALPGEYVWTYVRPGQGARLPAGWPNVIEVAPWEASVSGRAVTSVRGGDACMLPPKYPFLTAKEYGISWFRMIPDDGGWLTAGLPFSVQTLTQETPEGETVEVERLRYEDCSSEGVVFRKLNGDEIWEAGTAYLWKPVSPWGGTICFHAGETLVVSGNEGFSDESGFHAAFMPLGVEHSGMRVFMLDERGEKFVRAAAGSRIHTGRGYLIRPEGEGRSVRMIVRDDTDGIRPTGQAVLGPVPIYTLSGMKAGVWQPGEPLPASLPKGIYLTPRGKVVKP